MFNRIITNRFLHASIGGIVTSYVITKHVVLPNAINNDDVVLVQNLYRFFDINSELGFREKSGIQLARSYEMMYTLRKFNPKVTEDTLIYAIKNNNELLFEYAVKNMNLNNIKWSDDIIRKCSNYMIKLLYNNTKHTQASIFVRYYNYQRRWDDCKEHIPIDVLSYDISTKNYNNGEYCDIFKIFNHPQFNILEKNDNDDTAMHLILGNSDFRREFDTKEIINIIKFYIDAGGDISAKNKNGRFWLDYLDQEYESVNFNTIYETLPELPDDFEILYYRLNSKNRIKYEKSKAFKLKKLQKEHDKIKEEQEKIQVEQEKLKLEQEKLQMSLKEKENEHYKNHKEQDKLKQDKQKQVVRQPEQTFEHRPVHTSELNSDNSALYLICALGIAMLSCT